MILLTGATGSVGSRLLPMLLERGERVKCLVREPSRLGALRVDVQIVMGDLKELSDPFMLRQAMRGVDRVIHLAGSMRDQPGHPVEELNGMATVRMVEGAEMNGAGRFIYFSALGASPVQQTRFLRSKWTGQQAVEGSGIGSTVFRPSIVFDESDPWIELLRKYSFIPFVPVVGSGESRFQPVWAGDAAAAIVAALDLEGENRVVDLAGPETLTYAEIAALLARSSGTGKAIRRIPLPVAKFGMGAMKTLAGPNVFATWEEAELMQVSMTSPNGPADLESLGIEPRSMAQVLGIT